jgi:mono/diheme cytochrome c family protein
MGVAVIAAAALFIGGAARLASAEDGKALFDKSCMSCHGAGGKGDGPAAKMLKPPPGDFATTAKSLAEADIAKMVKEGGSEGKKHTAFGKKLSDDQIAAVAKYVKDLAGK